jgi:hypothetical protein
VDATAVVAIVSVVVTGAFSPYIGARVAASRFEEEKRRDREDELRSVMEAAGVTLTECMYAYGRLRADLPELTHAALEPYDAEMEQLWKNDDRLSVRLGSNAEEVHLYRAAIEEMGKARTTLREGLEDGFAKEVIDRMDDHHVQALDLQSRFYDAASGRIGPGERDFAWTARYRWLVAPKERRRVARGRKDE